MSYKRHLEKINQKIDDEKMLVSHFDELRNGINPWRETLRIIFIYIIVGSIWIIFSDTLLSIFAKDPIAYQRIQTFKGWIYVLLSGSVFYFLIRNRMDLFKAAADRIYTGYHELDDSHKELSATKAILEDRLHQLEYYQKALKESQLQYALSVEGSNDGFWNWDIRTGKYKTSTLVKKEFGYSQEIQSQVDTMDKWRSYVHPEDLDFGVKAMDNFLKGSSGIYENIFRIRTSTGDYRWILSRGKTVRDEEGKVESFAGSHTDITYQLELQDTLKKEKSLIDSISKGAPISIIVCDKNGEITKFNNHAESIFGYSEEELIGKNAFDFLGDDTQKAELSDLLPNLMQGEPLNNIELKVLTKDNRERTMLLSNTFVLDEKGIDSLVFLGVDISERKAMEDKLEVLAYEDRLTGLPNMSKFREEFQTEIIKSSGEKEDVALIYIDIDDFKLVNDTMGHIAGDLLLKIFSEDLLSFASSGDKVYRFGGDEFVLTIKSFEGLDGLMERLNDLIIRIRKPWQYNDHSFMISSSIGVAVYPCHGEDSEMLMQNADTALSYAKEAGKNRFLIYNDEMKDKTWSYIQLSSDLRSALDRKEFFLVYQPLLKLESGKIYGFEALIRWRHPSKGIVFPQEFIPFAEEIGLIEKIEDWVLESACSQSTIWQELGYSDLSISINISGKTLSKEEWIRKVGSHLSDCKDFSRIIFEITETAVIDDIEDSIHALEIIHDMGIQLALDDFGTGYSSLTYLQKLPIDIIKLDKSFVWSIGTDDNRSFIVQTVIDLAHNLGMKVVAEGVENIEQLEFLNEFGCDYAQGYYFSRPVDEEDVLPLLESMKFN